jgi:diguanylate cyclase (GGDEF)-like protein/putative nucleotidyltransferase with HDIG domain
LTKDEAVREVTAAVTTPLGGASLATSENRSSNGHTSLTALPSHSELVDSYRRLADVFHHVLSEHSLDSLLDRIADTLADLIPYDTLSIFQADEAQTLLTPVLARDRWADEIMRNKIKFGAGLAGWAAQHREPVLTNHAHLDKRMMVVPGTPPDEKEALITVPLIARGAVKGVLSIYRLGEDARFNEDEFELAKRFGDAAALAIDNAQTRARLELQAQTDSLTGLYNHRYFHESLRAELTRSSRNHDSVALLMLDIDDFKKVNDVYGHGVGDQVLRELAEQLKQAVRGSDVVCRLGGEEFGVVMGSCRTRDALGLATRLTERLAATEFGLAGKITVSIGVAEGPKNASNPRELIACAEAAMMAAKARGKDKIVLFDGSTDERPDSPSDITRDVRSISHLKMLQSLAGKLNRLTDVREIGTTIADELRALIDYHNCRVSLVEGDEIVPIAFRGVLSARPGEDAHIPRSKVGEGITGRAAEERKSLLIGNALDCEYAVLIPGTEPLEESLLAVPLCYGSRVVAVIVISKLGTNQFDEDDVRLLEVLGGHAAVALENARLFESQRREAEHLKELLEFSRELASAEGLPEVLRRIVELTATILGTPTTSVWLQDADSGKLVPAELSGLDGSRRELIESLSFDPEHVRPLADHDEPFVLAHDEAKALEGPPDLEPGVSFAIAPVKLDGGRLCCIVASIPAERADEFDEAKMSLLAGLAHQAKLAITNAGSFENLEATFVSTIEALANALEANDEYTSSHTRWITDMALKVGSELGLDPKELKRLELGALFHDIGKIGIPARILLKPGPLTPAERQIMQQHPELGAKILAPIERLAEVRAIVRSCHEHYDGKGYPDGRSGGEIPLESRIVLVCDAFHAMTTDRPYRKRLSIDEACRRLRDAAGTQFDPAVVDAFLTLRGESWSAALAS